MPSEKDGVMIILSSPSGAGKTTLVKMLSKVENFDISISHTTRQPRLNEKSNKATGCSIDFCVHFIQKLEHQYSVDLLDKMNVAFKQGEFISYKSLIEFKKLVKSNSVSKNTIVFNNLVTDVLDFNTNWEIPAYKSWHSRFFL